MGFRSKYIGTNMETIVTVLGGDRFDLSKSETSTFLHYPAMAIMSYLSTMLV